MGDGLQAFLNANAFCVRINIANAKGSTPRSGGTWMLVGETETFETIGGGQMEYLAIQHAREMIANTNEPSLLKLPLGPEIGQCCGGFVELEFEILNPVRNTDIADALAQEQEDCPRVYIFGAGHVGKALLEALSLLPLQIVMIDSRQDQLAQLPPAHERCAYENLAVPESVIADARPNSAFVILTHDHAQDFVIADAALHRSDAKFVGMIGSKTKRQTFTRQFLENENAAELLNKLICPIGSGGSNDKRPKIIATLVAAQIANVLFDSKNEDLND